MELSFYDGFIIGLMTALILGSIGNWWSNRYQIVRKDKGARNGASTASRSSPPGAP